ncbi:MAG: response regulator [Candidatus Zambryskibacteria bacterium]|nr:response regulator [Candidatus Zambryskibacteria bacterium]
MNQERQKTVLIIDDDSNLRKVLVDKLSLSGFKVVGAGDGEEGLNKALEIHPDIILLDILMPKMDGWAVLGSLRSDEWGKNAKIIMLTAVEDAKAVAKAVEDGSFSYIIKTENSMNEMIEKIEDVLGSN